MRSYLGMGNARRKRTICSIGIIGQQGSGKDTAAQIITKFWPGNVRVFTLAFADEIKEDVQRMGVNPTFRTLEVRNLLQQYGAKGWPFNHK